MMVWFCCWRQSTVICRSWLGAEGTGMVTTWVRFSYAGRMLAVLPLQHVVRLLKMQ